MKILLDLDGVIVDFVKGVIDWYKVDMDPKDWPVSCWDIGEGIDRPNHLIWNGLTENFWANLEFTEEAPRILNMLSGLDVCLLTSPSDTRSVVGKMEWISKNLPDFYFSRKVLIGPGKEFCACPTNLLIDDNTENCKKFIEVGGNAILYPARWNDNSMYSDNPISFLREELNEYGL